MQQEHGQSSAQPHIEARAWQPASASSQAAAVEVKEEEQSQGAYPELEEPDAIMGNEEGREQDHSGDAEKTRSSSK